MSNQPNNKIEKSERKVGSTQVSMMQVYEGPIPLARELDHYDKVLPGSADRILTMAEEQSKHRRRMEDEMLGASIKAERAGQFFGFVIFLSAVILGFTLIILGKDIIGLVSLLGAVGGIIGLFVYNRQDEKEELKKKNNVTKK